MKLQAYIRVLNQKGEIEIEKPANTLLYNFLAILRAQMSHASATGVKQDGSTASIGDYGDNFKLTAGSGDAGKGIIVGTSDEPVSLDDYNLKSKISHGSGSGQLEYGAMSIGNLTPSYGSDPLQYSFILSRTFNNLSGADITIKEVGLLVYAYMGGSQYILIDRTLLTVTIPNNEAKTIQYIIRVSK